MSSKILFILAGFFILLSLFLLTLPGQKIDPLPRKPIASIDFLQSKNKNPQLIRQDGTLTRSWATLLFAAQMNGWSGSLNGDISGVRTYREQKDLHRKFVRGVGPPAFHPDGPSRHILKNINRKGQWSQAVDVSKPEELIRVAKTLGVELYQPYRKDEPWHIEARKPFVLSGFFPGTRTDTIKTREPISATFLLLLIVVMAGLIYSVTPLQAQGREEKFFRLLAQGLLGASLLASLYNVMFLSNTVSFVVLAFSVLAFMCLLLLRR